MACKKQQIVARSKKIRGYDREAHFEADGDLTSWLGVSYIFKDRRHHSKKYACRQPVNDFDFGD
jgi:hypothetical protein